MKEDSKRLLRGMTEVSEQYIFEAEAFYQKKEKQDLVGKNRESLEREAIEKDSKNIERNLEEKGKIIVLAPKASSPDSLALQGTQGADFGDIKAGGWNAEEVDSLQKATILTGFAMRIPEGKEPFTKKIFTVIGADMIEVQYLQEESSAPGYSIRKARGEGDISGDFTEYEEVKEVNSEGRKVTLKGEAGRYSLALWEENGFSYSIGALEKPMTKEEILELVSAVE